jgi:two-component system cell cycle sensor histidine kinase/response regulator CckA
LKARILVVEDDQIIQFDLCRQLRQLDYKVAAAVSSGEEAIEKAAELEPDLVLMDVRLQGALDGIEAARQIRSARNVPVVYLTAQSGDEQVGSGRGLLEPRIAKPFTQKALQAGIENALAASKPQSTDL